MRECYAKIEYEHEFFVTKNMKPTYTRKLKDIFVLILQRE